MEVILLEKIRNLGGLGDSVNVKPGYGRNFLIPQRKAVTASKTNKERFEAQRAELESKAQAVLEAAQKRADALAEVKVTIEALASDEGKLYGSVSAIEIIKALQDQGHEVEKKEIILSDGVIHECGEFEIGLQLHTDVSIAVNVEVVPAKG